MATVGRSKSLSVAKSKPTSRIPEPDDSVPTHSDPLLSLHSLLHLHGRLDLEFDFVLAKVAHRVGLYKYRSGFGRLALAVPLVGLPAAEERGHHEGQYQQMAQAELPGEPPLRTFT